MVWCAFLEMLMRFCMKSVYPHLPRLDGCVCHASFPAFMYTSFSCFRNSLLWSSNTLTQLKLVYMKGSEALLLPDTIHAREVRWWIPNEHTIMNFYDYYIKLIVQNTLPPQHQALWKQYSALVSHIHITQRIIFAPKVTE